MKKDEKQHLMQHTLKYNTEITIVIKNPSSTETVRKLIQCL